MPKASATKASGSGVTLTEVVARAGAASTALRAAIPITTVEDTAAATMTKLAVAPSETEQQARDAHSEMHAVPRDGRRSLWLVGAARRHWQAPLEARRGPLSAIGKLSVGLLKGAFRRSPT